MFSHYCPRCKKVFDKHEHHLMCSNCGFQLSVYEIEKKFAHRKILRIVRPFLIFGLILLVLFGSYIFVGSKCKIGTVTENGGIIFFDKFFYSNGWRYMEISPVTLNSTGWSSIKNEKALNELEEGFAKGAKNSYTIIYRFGAKSAAYKAINYGESEDWYLGTRSEMKVLGLLLKLPRMKKAMEKNEKFSSLINTENENNIYWTSELVSKENAYAYSFDDGKIIELALDEKCFVRPIRKF